MAEFQAFLVITLLIWATFSVSGTTPELSTTTGDTVNIPCLFGEGTLRNIYWYYNDGTGPQKILFLAKRVITIEAEYANRASLQNDNSTLILKDITVADEGTYRCDVDRQGQTAVPNINTKLNVFSLRPDTFPVITQCIGAGGSSPCSIHANQSFILTCTFPNVFPVKDTELIWYQEGKRVSSTDDVTQNDDGTIDISRQIQVSETGNFTCNATYLSANGNENTAVSVKAWIILPADVPNTPGKNMTSGLIAGITLGILFVVFILAIITSYICRSKASAHCTFPNNTNSNAEIDQVFTSVTPMESEPFIVLCAQVGSKDGKVPSTEAEPFIGLSNITGSKDGKVKTSPTEEKDFDDILMALAEKIPDSHIDKLGKKLGFHSTAIEKYMATNSRHQNITSQGTLEMLRDWDKEQTKKTERAALKTALMDAGLVHLADDFFPEEGSAGDGDSQTPQPNSGDSQQDQDATTPLISSPKPITNISTATTTHATAPSICTTNSPHKVGDVDSPTSQPRNGDSQQDQESANPTGGTAENLLTNKEVDNSTLPSSFTVTHGENMNRPDQRRITDEEITKLSSLMLHDNYTDLCVALKFRITESQNILAHHQLNYNAAFKEILNKWKAKEGGCIRDLNKALVETNSGGLVGDYEIM